MVPVLLNSVALDERLQENSQKVFIAEVGVGILKAPKSLAAERHG